MNERFAEQSGVTADEVTTADIQNKAPAGDPVIEEYIDAMPHKPIASMFIGVLDYAKFSGALYESLTMSDDSADRAVRVAIVKVPSNNHCCVVVWQISKHLNDELLAHDADQDADDDGSEQEDDNGVHNSDEGE